MYILQSPYLNFIFETLLAEFIVTVTVVLVAGTVIRWWVNWKYGNWNLTVIKRREKMLDKIPISPTKMKQVLNVPEDMPVFLKGMCSPFHRIGCDLMREGVELGVLDIDYEARGIIIDLDKDRQESQEENDIL